MSWTLAPCIKVLFDEVNERWPHRDKTSDGTIGDAAHAARKSEHNPNADPNDDVPDGMVTAADIDKDGIDVQAVLDKLIGADRVWYVIWDRHIYSRTHGWVKNPYTGADPHTSHIHVSMVQHSAMLKNTKPWGIAHPATPTPAPAPVPAPTPAPVPPKKESEYHRVARIAHERLLRIKALKALLARRK